MKALLIAALLVAQTPAELDPFRDVSKHELWEAGVRFEYKWSACEEKLKIRTSTTINQIILPQALPTEASEGVSWGVVSAIGAVVILVGFVAGFMLGDSRSDGPIVVAP